MWRSPHGKEHGKRMFVVSLVSTVQLGCEHINGQIWTHTHTNTHTEELMIHTLSHTVTLCGNYNRQQKNKHAKPSIKISCKAASISGTCAHITLFSLHFKHTQQTVSTTHAQTQCETKMHDNGLMLLQVVWLCTSDALLSTDHVAQSWWYTELTYKLNAFRNGWEPTHTSKSMALVYTVSETSNKMQTVQMVHRTQMTAASRQCWFD